MRSISELNSRLSEERIWRVQECSSLADLAGRAGPNTVERTIHLRSGFVMFYSHLEGFVKRASTYYLKFLAYQRVPLNEMAPFLLRLYIKQQVVDTEPSSVDRLAEFFLETPSHAPRVVHKGQINTESNLSSKVFRSICAILNFQDSLFDCYLKGLDDPLLKNRNAIAHGERVSELTLEQLEAAKDLVIGLMTLFKDEIENAATARSYRISRSS